MTKVKIRSKHVASVGYDSIDQILEITFISGETYHHHGVPKSAYTSLIHSEHPGYYLLSRIRNTYPYKKVV
ncbi:KTSC domain-containing protein [Marinisporobacter balticus]|uniref:KTSC domain-containing protein n=1 Tax=Marinisporobacter balticus TaxID=2018667 RepID=A0A4R2KMA9_9FIRM|nr:KTSC domain-containing protein [Marinisporobacter balticus]TCO74564.1 KTSC domain-containing protein [Marinisporobacter balticus]